MDTNSQKIIPYSPSWSGAWRGRGHHHTDHPAEPVIQRSPGKCPIFTSQETIFVRQNSFNSADYMEVISIISTTAH